MRGDRRLVEVLADVSIVPLLIGAHIGVVMIDHVIGDELQRLVDAHIVFFGDLVGVPQNGLSGAQRHITMVGRPCH